MENGTALIDVRTGTARDVVMGLDATPAMVHADPPWRYDQGVGVRGGVVPPSTLFRSLPGWPSCGGVRASRAFFGLKIFRIRTGGTQSENPRYA